MKLPERGACFGFGGERKRVLWHDTALALVSCPRCGAEWLQGSAPGEQSCCYGHHDGAGLSGRYHSRRARPRAAYLAARSPHPGDLLDVGCGPGVSLIAAKTVGWPPVRIELDEDDARVGRARAGVPVLAGDLIGQAVWTDERVAAPHSSYGLSKRDQEDIPMKLCRRYGIPNVALRYSIVQGPRQSFRNAYSGALRSFAVRVLTGQPPAVYEDGEQLRDYVSIHDVVEANLLVVHDSRADYQVFNVGADRRVTVRELAQLVIETAGVVVEPQLRGLYRFGDTRHTFSDISKLQALGWVPQVTQSEIVREYLAWTAEQPDFQDTFAEAQARMKAAGVVRRARGYDRVSGICRRL